MNDEKEITQNLWQERKIKAVRDHFDKLEKRPKESPLMVLIPIGIIITLLLILG